MGMHTSYKVSIILSFQFALRCTVVLALLNTVNMDTYNSSQHFSTSQSDVTTHFTDWNDEVWINQTFLTTTQHDDYLSTSVKNDFIDTLITYSLLTISILGALGHILSLIIMLRPPFNEMPHSIICAALSGIDLAYMMLQISTASVNLLTGSDLMLQNDYCCKLSITVTLLCLHLDAFILVGLSIERIIAVFYPLKAKVIITKARIKILLLITFAFFIIFDGEMSFRRSLVENRNGEMVTRICEVTYTYGLPRRYFVMKDRITSALATVIPISIIFGNNIAILIKLARRAQDQAQLGVNTQNNANARTNFMLISVLLAYVLLNAPLPIYASTDFLRNTDFQDASVKILAKILATLATLSMGLNFYLYFFTSALFRTALKNVFRCGKETTQGDRVPNVRAHLDGQQARGHRKGIIPKRMRF